MVAAINAADRRGSLSARVHVSVNMFDEQLVGSGIYLEQAPARCLRLELNIQMGDQTATLLEVCDGQTLRTYRQQGQEQGILTHVDVARVLAASASPPAGGQAGALPRWPGIGGLPRLLRALREAFQFDVIEPTRLLQVPVWRIQGRWRAAQLAKLLPDQKNVLDQGQEVNFAKVAGQLPSHAVVFLGQDDMVPYRIEYRRVKKGGDLGDLESRATVMLALQLAEVSTNVSLQPGCFASRVGDLNSQDVTEQFLHSTGLR